MLNTPLLGLFKWLSIISNEENTYLINVCIIRNKRKKDGSKKKTA